MNRDTGGQESGRRRPSLTTTAGGIALGAIALLAGVLVLPVLRGQTKAIHGASASIAVDVESRVADVTADSDRLMAGDSVVARRQVLGLGPQFQGVEPRIHELRSGMSGVPTEEKGEGDDSSVPA